MPDDDAAKPVELPGNAPDTLKQFVACTTNSVELDLTDLGWIPKPDLPGNLEDVVTPSATVLDGSTPTSATVEVGYGDFIKITLPATIVDGALNIDGSDIPFGVGPAINKWVDAFNRTLRDNGKQLDTLAVRNGKIALTKKPIAAAADASRATVAPVASAVAGTTTTPEEETDNKPGWGCFAWLAGAVAAIAIAIGVAVSGGGDDTSENAVVSPTVAPATTSTTSTTTTTTIAEVGQAPPPVVDDVPEVRVCGDLGGVGVAQPSSGAYFVPPPSPCTPGPNSYANSSCGPLFLPCATGQSPPFYVPGGAPGIDHTRSVPDAVTGDEGASLAEFAAYVRAFLGDAEADATLRISSDCGGNIVTGETPVTNGEINLVEQRLISFGSCTVIGTDLIVTGATPEETFARELAATLGLGYTVGTAEPDPELPGELDAWLFSNDRYEIPNEWSFPSRTINQVFGAALFDDGCVSLFPPTDLDTEILVRVLEGCQFNDHFWVFAAGTTDVEVTLTQSDIVLGHGGAFVNEVGIAAPSGLDPISGSHPLDSIFPCGPGDIAFTACAPGDPTLDASAFVAVSAAMLDSIPIEADGTGRTHVIDFGPSGGPSFSVDQGVDGWAVSSTDGTRARALIRDNSLTLLAPQDELPPGPIVYVWTTMSDGHVLVQPPVPITGVIRTPPLAASGAAEPPAGDETTVEAGSDDGTAAGELTETLEEFYAQLSASIAAGDVGFALDRLDPTVFEAYPTECPAALESFADPEFSIMPIAQGDTGPWTWELSDGRTFDVPEALTVSISLSGRGQSGIESEAHLTTIDGQYRWFTFCDEQ